MQVSDLQGIPGLTIRRDVPLSEYTRFGLGGGAEWLIDAADELSFQELWNRLRDLMVPAEVIGGGSNLVVADEGCPGAILRFTGNRISHEGAVVTAQGGAVLQDLVDYTIECGLGGLHTMTGIPGWVGGAIYGNAGAYGRSFDMSVIRVRFFDGNEIREFSNEECRFAYRESIFKQHKDWVVLTAKFELLKGDSGELRKNASEIRTVRDAKYPPTMKCAGSIFKNLLFRELPERVQSQVDPKVVREGKVPSAWFLEQVGAKGMRNGDIHVADYHANLIYNAAHGTASQVREIITELKLRVCSRFGFSIEEEVQYLGFPE